MTQAAKAVLAVIVGIAMLTLIVVFSIMWGLGIGVFAEKAQANYQKRVSGAQITQNIYNATFRQGAYEKFFAECNDVVAKNGQIVIARRRLAETKNQPDDQFGQKANKVSDAASDLAGLEQQQLNVAADYNARSSEYTRNPFKDSNLPYRLDPPFTKYSTQSCGTETP